MPYLPRTQYTQIDAKLVKDLMGSYQSFPQGSYQQNQPTNFTEFVAKCEEQKILKNTSENITCSAAE